MPAKDCCSPDGAPCIVLLTSAPVLSRNTSHSQCCCFCRSIGSLPLVSALYTCRCEWEEAAGSRESFLSSSSSSRIGWRRAGGRRRRNQYTQLHARRTNSKDTVRENERKKEAGRVFGKHAEEEGRKESRHLALASGRP